MTNTKTQTGSMGGFMLAIFWIGIIVMLGAYFFAEEQQDINPNAKPQFVQRDGEKVLVLKPNRNGHFITTGRINGQKVTMLLDTGATLVSVPEKLADHLGLHKGRAGKALTANGPVTVYETYINELQLGNFALSDVPASINPGMNTLNEVLLGMSALSRLNFSLQNGNMELSAGTAFAE